MNNLVFGKYIPIDSFMHRLDPRAKLIGLFVMIFAIFLPKSWWAFLAIGVLVLLALISAKIGIRMIVQSFKPMIMMMIFLLVINSLTVKTGDVMFMIGSFSFTYLYLIKVLNSVLVVIANYVMSKMFVFKKEDLKTYAESDA